MICVIINENGILEEKDIVLVSKDISNIIPEPTIIGQLQTTSEKNVVFLCSEKENIRNDIEYNAHEVNMKIQDGPVRGKILAVCIDGDRDDDLYAKEFIFAEQS